MSAAKGLQSQFDFQTRLFNNVTDSISEAEAIFRSENTNNVKWIAGHMLSIRLGMMSKVLGLPTDAAYAELFGRGTVIDANIVYPTLDEIRERWKTSAVSISQSLGSMAENELTAKTGLQSPIFDIDDSVQGLLLFALTHEATHIGQLSILRRIIGKPAMGFR